MAKESFAVLEKNILYQDNHLIIINKLPSTIVQSDKSGDDPISEELKRYLKKKFNKPGNVYLGIVHRIDRPVSGIVLFARTTKALTRINEMFQAKEVTKTYWAVVKTCPPEISGTLVNQLKRNEAKNTTIVLGKPSKDSKEAILNYQLINEIDGYYLLEITLITGRHHQIRAQLGHIGCPIVGDNKYGYQRANKDYSIHLHSRTMAFVHPVTKENVIIEAELPDDVIWNRFKK